MRTLLLAGLALILAAGTAFARCEDHIPQPKPQNASRDIVGQDLDTIQERGFITFAVYEDFPPYSWEAGGKPMGLDIDIGRLIAEDLGVEARFRFTAAGETLDADLRNTLWRGPIVGGAVSNVMLRVPYDSEFACRVEQVVFTGQYVEERLGIAYRTDAYPESPPVPAFFRFDTVAVENDSISDFYLSSLLGGAMVPNIRRMENAGAAMAALRAGEVNAAMAPISQLEAGAEDGIAVHAPPLPGLARSAWTVGLGVHFAYRPLAYSVDDAISYALRDGRIEAIYAAHGLSFHPPQR
ncbi:MAG: transporter substrate-binding domain-containing protein [Pseudomonadota bacterium]